MKDGLVSDKRSLTYTSRSDDEEVAFNIRLQSLIRQKANEKSRGPLIDDALKSEVTKPTRLRQQAAVDSRLDVEVACSAEQKTDGYIDEKNSR